MYTKVWLDYAVLKPYILQIRDMVQMNGFPLAREELHKTTKLPLKDTHE